MNSKAPWTICLLGILTISTSICARPVRASEFLEGFVSSALILSGFEVTSDGSNEAKRAEVDLVRDDAAEVVAGEQVRSAALHRIFDKVRQEIQNQDPDYDLSTLSDAELARTVLKELN